MIRRLGSWFLDLVWPRKCVVCRRILEKEPGFLCPDCRAGMPRPHPGPKRGENYSGCVSVCSYEGAWRESLLRYKFGGKRAYARAYGPLLAEVIARELTGQYDVITYIPLSKKRRRARGYDQARLLAEQTALALGTEVRCLLRRRRHSPPQSGFNSPAARRANILGAYEAPDPDAVRGLNVLLIDDILTTGATASEAARILLQAGAASVVCAVFGLTPPKTAQDPPAAS